MPALHTTANTLKREKLQKDNETKNVNREHTRMRQAPVQTCKASLTLCKADPLGRPLNGPKVPGCRRPDTALHARLITGLSSRRRETELGVRTFPNDHHTARGAHASSRRPFTGAPAA